MQLTIDLDGSENAVGLDRIIDMVLDNAEARRRQQFDYMRLYERKFMDEIKKYSHRIRNPEFDKYSWPKLEETFERKSSVLHDVMAEACIAYLKHGMKLGACILLQLLH